MWCVVIKSKCPPPETYKQNRATVSTDISIVNPVTDKRM